MSATPHTVSAELEHTSSRAGSQDSPASGAGQRSRFFLVMSGICLAIAVIGFMPTFFVPLATGQFSRPPVYYVHASFFFGWVAFYFNQSRLIYKGRILAHREWGVVGAALLVGMVFSVLILDVVELNQKIPLPVPPTVITWSSASVMTGFAISVAAGLANVRRPEVHKRFMLIATIGLLSAPIGRLPASFLAPPNGGPPSIWIGLTGAIVTLMLYAAAMVYDKTRTGRISRIYIFGLIMGLVLGALSASTATSPLWLSATNWIRALAG